MQFSSVPLAGKLSSPTYLHRVEGHPFPDDDLFEVVTVQHLEHPRSLDRLAHLMEK